MVGKFCGKIAPSPIISSGGQLLIKFVSDYETHGAGFSVRYEVFKTGGSSFSLQRFQGQFRVFPGDSRSSELASGTTSRESNDSRIPRRGGTPPAEGRNLAPVSYICLPPPSGVHLRSRQTENSSSPAGMNPIKHERLDNNNLLHTNATSRKDRPPRWPTERRPHKRSNVDGSLREVSGSGGSTTSSSGSGAGGDAAPRLPPGRCKVPRGRRRAQPEFEAVIPKLGFSRHLYHRF